MGTRRASSSPARTELVNAVRTLDTATEVSGAAMFAARRVAKRSANPPTAGAGRSAGSRCSEAHHRRGRTLAETGGAPAHLELEIEHPAEGGSARGEAGEGNRAGIEGQLGTIDGALHQELAVEVVAGSERSARISHD